MRKLLLLTLTVLLVSGCSILSELTAFTKCEFSFHSAQNPIVCGIDVTEKRSGSDFSFFEGQVIASSIFNGALPFEITANVEVRNPGKVTAAVNSIQWIAFIDEIQVAQGVVENPVEVAPGGFSILPVRIQANLFDYLEGDKPLTMLNFALNMVNASNQPSRLAMKIKPSVIMGSQTINYPGYFTITKEFTGGTS